VIVCIVIVGIVAFCVARRQFQSKKGFFFFSFI